jgi:hypothetical protein
MFFNHYLLESWIVFKYTICAGERHRQIALSIIVARNNDRQTTLRRSINRAQYVFFVSQEFLNDNLRIPNRYVLAFLLILFVTNGNTLSKLDCTFDKNTSFHEL